MADDETCTWVGQATDEAHAVVLVDHSASDGGWTRTARSDSALWRPLGSFQSRTSGSRTPLTEQSGYD